MQTGGTWSTAGRTAPFLTGLELGDYGPDATQAASGSSSQDYMRRFCSGAAGAWSDAQAENLRRRSPQWAAFDRRGRFHRRGRAADALAGQSRCTGPPDTRRPLRPPRTIRPARPKASALEKPLHPSSGLHAPGRTCGKRGKNHRENRNDPGCLFAAGWSFVTIKRTWRAAMRASSPLKGGSSLMRLRLFGQILFVNIICVQALELVLV